MSCKEKIICIYIIISPSNKIYIGQTKNFQHRLCLYRNLRCKAQLKLYSSFIKYGFNNHKINILIECKESELDNWEIFYIKLLNSIDRETGLNLKNGGHKGTHGEETRKKMSEIQKQQFKNGRIAFNTGKHLSEETKEKLRKINLGKKQSEETKQKKREISLKNGNKPPKIIWTDERRKRWSEMTKGEKNGNYGKGMKPHVKEILIKCNVGKKMSEEFKLNTSKRFKGVPKSEEWKAKNRKPKSTYIKNGVDVLKRNKNLEIAA